jgi:hypothetical protein
VISIALFAAFVFRADLVVPACMLLLTVSATAGPRGSPIPRLFSTVARPLLDGDARPLDAHLARLAVLIDAVLLIVATLLGVIGIHALGWAAALAVALAGAFDAATGSWIVARLWWRLAPTVGRDSRPNRSGIVAAWPPRPPRRRSMPARRASTRPCSRSRSSSGS